MRRETAGEQTGKRVDVNYRQLKQAASEATHEPLPYVSASRQGVRVHPPHPALACRSGPKGCLLFIGSIFTRRPIRRNRQTELSNSPPDIPGGQRLQLEHLNRTQEASMREARAKQEAKAAAAACRIPCRLKPTVPCGGNDGCGLWRVPT